MVRLDRVDDFLRLLELLRDVDSELNVGSLDLLSQRLADIVKQSRALCQRAVDAELVREDVYKRQESIPSP